MTNAQADASSKQVGEKHHGFWYDLFRRLIREKPLGTFGLVVVALLFLTGIFASFIAPYPMNAVHLADRLSPPSTKYLLGADQLGTDVLSQIIYGARISMVIGICGTLLSKLISTIIGVVSGFMGGKTDLFLQRFVDAFMAIPQLLVLMTIMSIIGNGVIQVIVVLGITTGISSSRVIRSAVIAIKSNMYMQAADAIGCGSIRTMIRHILPNIMATIIVDFTIVMGVIILQEASLSFLGYGVPPDVPSWGSMLSLEGEKYMLQAPALALWPGFVLSIVVYGINMFGDALRDLLDPRLRGGVGQYTLNKKKLKKIKESIVNQLSAKL
jgi:peptide/nickel transport system permease protein